VQAEGIEHVPADGGALLVASCQGSSLAGAAMIARAVAQEHPHPRRVSIATGRHFSGVPGLGMLLAKLGGVSSHAENLHRLLFDERELVLVFADEEVAPAGPPGADVTFAEVAARAEVPLIPVEVSDGPAPPVIGRLVRGPLPLPVKRRIRFRSSAAPRPADSAP